MLLTSLTKPRTHWSFAELRLALATAAVGSVIVLLAVATSSQAEEKLMLVGDSITHGFGAVGYRYPLYYNLVDNGFSTIDYVGTQDEPATGYDAGDYPLYDTTFDKDHEGHSGYRTDQILDDGMGFTLAESARTHIPDVVSILLGTNDIVHIPGNTAPQAVANVSTMIDQLRAVNSNVKVLVAQIIPIGEPVSNAQVPVYNSLLATMVEGKRTAASPVEIVDQNTGFTTQGMTFDNVHPNVYGERLMADRFFVGLQKLIAPSVPVISPQVLVQNNSFEDHGSFDGGIAVGALQQAWNFEVTTFAGTGLYNPLENTYHGASGVDGTPEGAEGKLVAFVNNATVLPDESVRAAITQQMGSLLQAGNAYTLTVAIGRRAEKNEYGSTYGGYEIELLAGGTVVESERNVILPEFGTFADASFTVLSDHLDPDLYGSELSIRLRSTELGQTWATDFDNVRLTVTPVPEPSALLISCAGGAVFIYFFQRFRHIGNSK